jgi:hypothetical protein
MNPIDYGAMTRMLMSQMVQPIADDPFSRRDTVNPLMGLEGAGGPRAGGGRMRRLYHGTESEAPFKQFDLGRAREGAVFMTPHKAVAENYRGGPDGQFGRTIPLDVNLSNAARVDWSKITTTGKDIYNHKDMKRAVDAAKRHGKDFLIIDNIRDWGKGSELEAQTQILALRPSGKVKNAATGGTMLSGLLGLLDRAEPLPPM